MIKEGVLGELSELPNNCVYLKCVEGERIFNKGEIIYAESEGHRCTIHHNSGDYHIYVRLDDLEKAFGDTFLRVHQSFLVNMEYVNRISNYKLTLNNDIVLPVPKARFKQVLRTYEEYQWVKALGNSGEYEDFYEHISIRF